EEHENERGQRREQAGGQEGDPGLVAERRKVVDAGEAHDLPPRRLVVDLGGRRPTGAFKEPEVEPAARPVRRALGHGDQISPLTTALRNSSSVASRKTPSHRATTTDARQLPMTLVIVRPMSISVSTPRISVTPSSGRP